VAINTVADYFCDYIRKLSAKRMFDEDGNVFSCIDEDMCRRLETKLTKLSGATYYDNHLVVTKPNGVPYRRKTVSANFGHLLQRLVLPHQVSRHRQIASKVGIFLAQLQNGLSPSVSISADKPVVFLVLTKFAHPIRGRLLFVFTYFYKTLALH
jgi:hypothetical protein